MFSPAHSASSAEALPLLLAEHAALALATWATRLREAGHDVTVATGAEAVRSSLLGRAFGAVVVDACLPSDQGSDWQQLVRSVDADVPLLLLAHDHSCEATQVNAALSVCRLDHAEASPHSALATIAEALTLHQAALTTRLHAGQNHLVAMPPPARDALRTRFAAATHRLYMAYQPIVDSGSQQLYGYEALVRSEEAGLSAPHLLFEAAEKLGGLFALGRRIRQQVATDLCEQRLPDGSYLFVNLHARDLLDSELYDVRSPLAAHAERVVFEITERTSLDAIDRVAERLGRLRALGFRIAIDDLGAGFAGLSSLALLDPHVVKLDMALVRDVDASPRKQAIIGALIKLCAELRVTAVAEGVETAAERTTLERCGCRLLQGYYFGRPGRGFAGPTWTGEPEP